MTPDCFNVMDLRDVDPELLELLIEVRASVVESNGSFWIVTDHDPVDLCDFIDELGFTVQTYICGIDEYRIFLGRM